MIKNRCGKDNPFTVPEGYFDTLNERIMASVDKSERRKTIWIRWCTTAAAACVAGLLLFNALAPSVQQQQSDIFADIDFLAEDEAFQKEVLNYSLVDNEDVYYYLSGIDY